MYDDDDYGWEFQPRQYCIDCGAFTGGTDCKRCYYAEGNEDSYVPYCEACGEPIDYCQGHGSLG